MGNDDVNREIWIKKKEVLEEIRKHFLFEKHPSYINIKKKIDDLRKEELDNLSLINKRLNKLEEKKKVKKKQRFFRITILPIKLNKQKRKNA